MRPFNKEEIETLKQYENRFYSAVNPDPPADSKMSLMVLRVPLDKCRAKLLFTAL